MYLAAESQSLALNGTFWLELIAFLVMLAVLWRYAYPPISAAAERRQRAIAEALENAEKAQKEAQEKLEQATRRLEEARQQAEAMIAGAGKSAEQVRQEIRERGEEEARRMVEQARREIESARRQALDSVRESVADLVVIATEKVVGESLDGERQKRLIQKAIDEVAASRE